LEELRAEFRREVGYWKSRHAHAVKRIEQLKEELDQSRGQTRALQEKLALRHFWGGRTEAYKMLWLC
jgi:hypothetical protein